MAALDCCCVKTNGHSAHELERQPDPRQLKAVESAPRQVQPYAAEEYVIGGRRNQYLPRLDTDQLTEDERNAHHRGHHCTDVLCLVIFVTCFAGLVWLYIYSREHGDIRRLYHGINFKGEVCGVDQDVEDLPWLFWCAKAGDPVREGDGRATVLAAQEDIDYDHPICVDVCPGGGDANFHHQCFQDREVQRGEADRTGSFVERITYRFRLVEDYTTQALAGGYCVPQNVNMLKALEEHVGYTETVTLAAEEVGDCWLVLVLAAVVAIVLGYVYLFFLQCCAGAMLYVTIALAALLPIVAGGVFLYGYYVEDIEEIFVRHVGESRGFEVPSTGNKQWDLLIAWALVALGLLVAALSCCCARTIELTVAVIEAVADCISDTPSFLLQPLASTAVKLAVFAALAHGLGWLITVGEVQAHADLEVIPAGLARTFSYDRKEQFFILYYLFMAAWILELLHALDIFVVSYATQLWFYKDQNSLGRKTMTLFPVLRGFCIGLTFHLGTLAVGSFLLFLFKMAYYILASVARRIEEAADRDGDGRADGVVGCCLACCCCCMAIWEAFIRFMNKNAYIVTAIESKAFCPAAQTAFTILASEPILVASVAGATWLVTAGAIIVIVALGMYLTWLMLHMIPWFTDPTSEHFVSEPEAVTAVAGVICFIIAVTFMSVFDTVADTILFCYIMDRRERAAGRARQGDYLPPRLEYIFGREGASGAGASIGSGPEDHRARAPLLDRSASKWA